MYVIEIARLTIETLKFIFPAYCANAIPVIIGGGRPLDGGKLFLDGKPIFGENKTFKGFFSGLAFGAAVGFIENILFNFPIFFSLVLPLGALIGDLTGAFVKRRLGIAPGDSLPIVDQVDFIVGAILFSLPLYMIQCEFVIAIFIITPPIHLLSNYVAYKLGLKSNPW